MTDPQAFAALTALTALAGEPYPWARPGARFRHVVYYGRDDKTPAHHGGVVVARAGAGRALAFTLRRDGERHDEVWEASALARYAEHDGDVFEPEGGA